MAGQLTGSWSVYIRDPIFSATIMRKFKRERVSYSPRFHQVAVKNIEWKLSSSRFSLSLFFSIMGKYAWMVGFPPPLWKRNFIMRTRVARRKNIWGQVFNDSFRRFFFNNEKNSKLISKKNTFSFQKHPRLLFTKLSSMMIRHLFLATKYRDTVYIYIVGRNEREIPDPKGSSTSSERERERRKDEERGEGGEKRRRSVHAARRWPRIGALYENEKVRKAEVKSVHTQRVQIHASEDRKREREREIRCTGTRGWYTIVRRENVRPGLKSMPAIDVPKYFSLFLLSVWLDRYHEYLAKKNLFLPSISYTFFHSLSNFFSLSFSLSLIIKRTNRAM